MVEAVNVRQCCELGVESVLSTLMCCTIAAISSNGSCPNSFKTGVSVILFLLDFFLEANRHLCVHI